MDITGTSGDDVLTGTADPDVINGLGGNDTIDGDTFWLDRTKYRIADIDAPEVGRPRCQAELERGQRATVRLAELLDDGRFEVQPTGLDKFGRTLAIVNIDGRSIGIQLVRERLAHVWGGPDRSWC